MKVLLIHNFYLEPGGEDQVFSAEGDLLREHGHTVIHYTMHNKTIVKQPALTRMKSVLWNPLSYLHIRQLIQQHRPDVAHFHNIFPLISPSGYYAAHAEKVPIVQTLHNYRMFCLNGIFFRDQHVCLDCFGKLIPWPGVKHTCYRRSRLASLGAMSALVLHRLLKTWKTHVDQFIALTEFSRNVYLEGGIDPDRITLKPNFLQKDPEIGTGLGGYALFVGRLVPEKGLETIINAWEKLKERVPIKIVGDGEMAPRLTQLAHQLPGFDYVGPRSQTEVVALMKNALVLIFPSMWYECLPRTIIEAYGVGLPVVASNIGAMKSLIHHGKTGLHFIAGDSGDLAEKVLWAKEHPQELAAMRKNSRAVFEQSYMADRNHTMLMEVYDNAAKICTDNH